MTYGWALLIVIVVIGALFYAGVLNPSNVAPTSCILPAGFSCHSYKLDSTGKLHLTMGQATGKAVTITGIACSTNAAAGVTATSVTIENGRSASVTGSGVQCDTVAGRDIYRGKIIFTYTKSGSDIIYRGEGDLAARRES